MPIDFDKARKASGKTSFTPPKSDNPSFQFSELFDELQGILKAGPASAGASLSKVPPINKALSTPIGQQPINRQGNTFDQFLQGIEDSAKVPPVEPKGEMAQTLAKAKQVTTETITQTAQDLLDISPAELAVFDAGLKLVGKAGKSALPIISKVKVGETTLGELFTTKFSNSDFIDEIRNLTKGIKPEKTQSSKKAQAIREALKRGDRSAFEQALKERQAERGTEVKGLLEDLRKPETKESIKAELIKSGIEEKNVAKIADDLVANAEKKLVSETEPLKATPEEVTAAEEDAFISKMADDPTFLEKSEGEIALTLNDIARQSLREVAVTPKEEIISGQPQSPAEAFRAGQVEALKGGTTTPLRNLEVRQRTGVSVPSEDPTITERQALRRLLAAKQQLSKQIVRETNKDKREALKVQRENIREVFKLRYGIKRTPTTQMSWEEAADIQQIKKELGSTSNLDTLRKTYEKIKTLRTLGREKYIHIQTARKEQTDLIANTIAKQIAVNPASKDIKIGSKEEVSKLKELGMSVFRPDRIIDQYLDGNQGFNGIGHKEIVDRLRTARGNAFSNSLERENRFIQHAVEGGIITAKEFQGELIPDDVSNLVKKITIKTPEKNWEFDKSSVLGMWAFRKDMSWAASFMFGNKMPSKVYRDAVRQLTPREKAAADAMGNIIRERFAATNETMLKVTDGEQVLDNVRGYAPIIPIEADNNVNYLDQLMGESKTRLSFKNYRFLKDRQKSLLKSNAKPVMSDIFEMGFYSIPQQERFINMAEAIRDVADIIRHPKIVNALKQAKDGDIALKQIQHFVQMASNPFLEKSRQALSVAARTLRNNVAKAFLPFQVTTAAVQLSGFLPPLATKEIGVDELIAGTWDLWRNWKELSPIIRELDGTIPESGVHPEIAEFKASNPAKFAKLENKITRTGMHMIISMDRLVRQGVWWSKYNKALAEGSSVPEAVRQARDLVLRTQSTSHPMDLASLYTDDIGGLVGLFQNQLNNYFNIVTKDIPNSPIPKSKGDKVRFTAQGWAVMAMMFGLEWMIRNGKAPSDKHDVYDMIVNSTSMVPGAGQIIPSALQGFDPQVSALESLPREVGKVVNRASKGDLTGAIEPGLKTAGMLKGLPVLAPLKFAKGAKEVFESYLKDEPIDLRKLYISGWTLDQQTDKKKKKREKAFKKATKKAGKQLSSLTEFFEDVL